jgi:tetratricopeptide (TPR) repeat protein
MNALERTISTWWLNRKASFDVLLDRKASAIEDLRRIVAMNPHNEVARAALGNLLAETRDRTAAKQEFEAIVAGNPGNAEAWFNLGYLHDQHDDLQEAERAFRRAVELKPSIDRAWYGLGLVLIRQGRLNEATAALRRNIKLQPFSPYGYYQLGMTYHHLGNAAEAEKIHEELQKFEPKYAATLKRDLAQTPPQALQRSTDASSTREDSQAHGT